MDTAEDTRREKPLSIRSVSMVILWLAISCFAVVQYQHNKELKARIDKLTFKVNSRSVYDDELNYKIDRGIDMVSDKPRLGVQDVLARPKTKNNGG